MERVLEARRDLVESENPDLQREEKGVPKGEKHPRYTSGGCPEVQGPSRDWSRLASPSGNL